MWQKVESQGFPWMAVIPTLVGVVLLAYPLHWFRRLWRDRMRAAEAWSMGIPLLAALGFSLSIIPASRLDLGWVILPTAVALTSFVYLLIFGAVLRSVPGADRPETSMLLGFLVPMVLLAAVLIWGAWSQYTRSFHAASPGFSLMRDVAMVNFLFLGVVPPIASAIGMFVRWLSAVVPPAREDEDRLPA